MYEEDSIDGSSNVLWILPTYTQISVHCHISVYWLSDDVYDYKLYVALFIFVVVVVTFLKGIYIHVPINTILNFDGDRKKDCI